MSTIYKYISSADHPSWYYEKEDEEDFDYIPEEDIEPDEEETTEEKK